MIKKSRFVLAVGATLALGVSTLAFADGASENTAFVDGSVKPGKLDKKKYKPISLFSGVRTEANVTGQQQNPANEVISYPKNVKFDFNAGDTCTTLPPSGSTAAQARNECPPDSYLGSGHAEVYGGSPAPNTPVATDVTVSVFRGPDKKGIQLHTFSPTLGPAAPTVLGRIVKSNAGGQFGPALLVEDAPDAGGDAFMITKFNATIFKSSGVSLARCKDKKFVIRRTVTYDDGSQDVATDQQRCKQKNSGGN